MTDSFQCLVVRSHSDGEHECSLETREVDELPPGDVLIRVRASSLNYKDALAASGHPGIVKSFPHVPGIDAWGEVLMSRDSRFVPGQEVLVTGHELGVERWGGWSEQIRVPAEWVLPLPVGLTGLECMQLGTAGFTAAQCVQALQRQGISPNRGPIAVTGATGGVALISIMLLVKLGYEVVAITGKQDRAEWLRSLGAADVCGRDVLKISSRPLQSGKFAGGVDTVGGPMLASLIKQTNHRGCIACCGVAGGADLPLTVYPFILRGITLAGIDSAWCPMPERQQIWNRLGSEWKLDLGSICHTIPLAEAPRRAAEMLSGKTYGRTVIEIG